MLNVPPFEILKFPKSGSGFLKFAIGGILFFSNDLIAIASSKPAPIGCPVNPFVFAIWILFAPSAKFSLNDLISAAALPPLFGV